MEVLNNGIKVPDRYAGEFNKMRTRDRDPDYRVACIRDYIKAHPDQTITLQELAHAAYGYTQTTGYTGALVRKLMKNGRITRKRVKDGTRGLSYHYQWHETRQITPRINSSGPVTTRSLNLPDVDFDDDELKKIDKFILKFTEDITLDTGDVAGAVRFRNWLARKHRKQVKAREEALKNDG